MPTADVALALLLTWFWDSWLPLDGRWHIPLQEYSQHLMQPTTILIPVPSVYCTSCLLYTSSHFAVSVRTIRNDLGYIESFLKSLNIHLERRSRIGIWIENKFHAINKIGIQMQYMDNSMYRVFSRRERVEKIIGILFIAEGYVTCLLYTSRCV